MLEGGRPEEAERLAHSVKGVAGNVGAGPLQLVAGELEAAIRTGDAPAIPDKLAAFNQALAAVVEALKVLGDEAAAGAPAPGTAEASPQELSAALDELVPHLKTRKPKQCQEAMDRLGGLAWPARYSVEKVELAKLVKKYKFKEAIPLVESLQTKLKE
jgi:HPt (histidine-containing phosphotransfer) domain-containing protein